MLATAGVGIWHRQYKRSIRAVRRNTGFALGLFMRAVFFCMRLVVALAFHMLGSSLAQTSAVLALGYGPAFLVDMYEGTIWERKPSASLLTLL